jgi:hypothetical protein
LPFGGLAQDRAVSAGRCQGAAVTALNWAKQASRTRMRQRGVESVSGARSAPSNQSPHGYGHSDRPPTPDRLRLTEPIIVAEFWANRHGESVRIQLREFKGLALLDIRKHYVAAGGKMLPTKKGLSIAIARLPDLAAAITKALGKARELGLLDGEASHE